MARISSSPSAPATSRWSRARHGPNLPGFSEEGLLPPGGYALTLDEIRVSILVRGPKAPLAAWDARWRRHLVDNLEILTRQLWEVGIEDIFIDGSFVEDKAHPNDIDGCFGCALQDLASGDLERRLNRLDPHKVWTWDPASRRSCRGSPKKQLPMWHRYRIELYPHCGQPSGIRDPHGNELEFPAAFRIARNEHPHGIVRLRRR